MLRVRVRWPKNTISDPWPNNGSFQGSFQPQVTRSSQARLAKPLAVNQPTGSARAELVFFLD